MFPGLGPATHYATRVKDWQYEVGTKVAYAEEIAGGYREGRTEQGERKYEHKNGCEDNYINDCAGLVVVRGMEG